MGVKLRGEAMQEAAEASKQKMLSVAGLSRGTVDALCVEAAKEEGPNGTCSVTNCLFPQGFSVGGSEQAITLLKDKVEKAGALQAKILKTGGAFHTSLMKPAQEMIKEGITEYYECGPMKQMKAMMKRIDVKMWKNMFNIDV